MDKGFSCREGERGAETGDIFEVVKSCFCYRFYVLVEIEGTVQDDSKVTAVG